MSWGSSKLEAVCLLKYKLRQEYNTHRTKNLELQARVLYFQKILPQIKHRAEHNSKDGLMVLHVDFSVTFSIWYQKKEIS